MYIGPIIDFSHDTQNVMDSCDIHMCPDMQERSFVLLGPNLDIITVLKIIF